MDRIECKQVTIKGKVYRIGDTLPIDCIAKSFEEACKAGAPEVVSGILCTREKGHNGAHVMTGVISDHVIYIWKEIDRQLCGHSRSSVRTGTTHCIKHKGHTGPHIMAIDIKRKKAGTDAKTDGQ